ncbi:hypothetical protein RJT34_14442 [Clitoria ternatea]|uniref:Uncharacterized protein n=1 Tax=Clitoria ternatea TaxID=43366 RepID=A0AAN9JQF5_CLITE
MCKLSDYMQGPYLGSPIAKYYPSPIVMQFVTYITKHQDEMELSYQKTSYLKIPISNSLSRGSVLLLASKNASSLEHVLCLLQMFGEGIDYGKLFTELYTGKLVRIMENFSASSQV